MASGQPTYPEGYMKLVELTSRSARMGKWQLAVFHPWEDTYEYEFDGVKKQGVCFKTFLVDVHDNTTYCHAEFKKTKKNETAYRAAIQKYTEGKIFSFENIAFADSRAEFQSATKREVINLERTTGSHIPGKTKDGGKEAIAVQPRPTGSVAD